MKNITFVILLIFVSTGLSFSPIYEPIETKSPITGKKLIHEPIYPDSRFRRHQDLYKIGEYGFWKNRDFIVTDTDTGYSARESDFRKGIYLTEELIKKIKDEMPFRPLQSISGLSQEEIPAYVKCDLLIQSYEFLTKEGIKINGYSLDETIAKLYQDAAYAMNYFCERKLMCPIEIEEPEFLISSKNIREKIKILIEKIGTIEKDNTEKAILMIHLGKLHYVSGNSYNARIWFEKVVDMTRTIPLKLLWVCPKCKCEIKTPPKNMKCPICDSILERDPKNKPIEISVDYKKYVQDWYWLMRIENSFRLNANELYLKLIENNYLARFSKKLQPEIIYMIGENYRRCGELELAGEYYNKADKLIEDPDSPLKKLIEEQKKLITE